MKQAGRKIVMLTAYDALFASLVDQSGADVFLVGHAYYMKAIHGGKAKNDKIDANKIARLLRGGNFPLAYAYAHARTIRLADGPDEVHRNQIGKLELKKYDRLTN